MRWRHKSLESGADPRVSTPCYLQITSHLYPRKQQCCTTTVHWRQKRQKRKRKIKKVSLEPGTDVNERLTGKDEKRIRVVDQSSKNHDNNNSNKNNNN